jgi:hypothetical protein
MLLFGEKAERAANQLGNDSFFVRMDNANHNRMAPPADGLGRMDLVGAVP